MYSQNKYLNDELDFILELYRNLSILDKVLIVVAILVIAVGISCLA
jgi:hypothetical protein